MLRVRISRSTKISCGTSISRGTRISCVTSISRGANISYGTSISRIKRTFVIYFARVGFVGSTAAIAADESNVSTEPRKARVQFSGESANKRWVLSMTLLQVMYYFDLLEKSYFECALI